MGGAGCVCEARAQPRAMWPETPSRVPHLGSPERRSVGPPRVAAFGAIRAPHGVAPCHHGPGVGAAPAHIGAAAAEPVSGAGSAGRSAPRSGLVLRLQVVEQPAPPADQHQQAAPASGNPWRGSSGARSGCRCARTAGRPAPPGCRYRPARVAYSPISAVRRSAVIDIVMVSVRASRVAGSNRSGFIQPSSSRASPITRPPAMARTNPPAGSADPGMRPISVTRLIAWPCLRPLASASVKASAGMSASAVATGSSRSGEAGAVSSVAREFVQGNRLRLGERPDPEAAKCGDMAQRAAGEGEVAGQAAHVDALAGCDLEDGGIGVGRVRSARSRPPGPGGAPARAARPSRAMS